MPLTSSWQDCEEAARSMGFVGDPVNFVEYDYPWGTKRPQGCFRSDGNNRFHFNRGAGGDFKGNDRILCIRKAKYDLRAGATCAEGYKPLTSSWQDCEEAARSMGFVGDAVNFVEYDYPWGTKRPQGCFRSDGNNRFHFNRGAGG